MAIIRNAANQKLRGRAGSMTYYVSEGRQIVRQALNNSNYGKTASRTEAQQSQRVKWANLVNFYKVCRGWMPKAFEVRKSGQSDYNRLMQVNMPYTNIYLTKTLATVGACIAEDYIISQGSLPSVDVVLREGSFETNLYIGGMVITNLTTVSQFAQALVENNVNIEYGMQLSFVALQQSVDNLGIPRLICTFYEVTLKADNEEPLYNYMPAECVVNHNNAIATGPGLGTGAFAYVVSDLRNGSLKVSTQQLVTNNETLITQFSSKKALNDAIISYGLDPEVVLSPLSENEQGVTPTPFYITSLMAGTDTFVAGDEMPIFSELTAPFSLAFSTDVALSAIDYVLAHTTSKEAYIIPFTAGSGNSINIALDDYIGGGDIIDKITVRMTSGILLEIPFTPVDGE